MSTAPECECRPDGDLHKPWCRESLHRQVRDQVSAAQDGRARAIEAAREGIKWHSWEAWETGDLPTAPEDFAKAAIDAALDSGGVVTREEVQHARSLANLAGIRRERAEAELYRLRCHAAMLADHVRGLVTESDRVEREGDDAEQDWTRPLIDMPVRRALQRLMGTLAHLTEHWDEQEREDPDPFKCQRCTVPIAYVGHHGDLATHVAPGLDPDRTREALDANEDHEPLPETRDTEQERTS